MANEQTMIDLRSDTVTHPTQAMRDAMAAAIVGDDQYGEDPTVNRLEALAAEMVGKEAAVYVASGTMGNLAAVLAHCERGSEVILGDQSHIIWYESAGISAVGSVMPRTVENRADGSVDLEAVAQTIRQTRPGYPPTRLVAVENTHNRCGGTVLPMAFLRDLRALADAHDLPVHMDGARIFNAAASLGIPASEIAAEVDSVQFCLSKGLGAPVGSIVAGTSAYVERVRAMRKLLGGAMRQAGVIAAAGIVALETMVDRLPEDHARARRIAEAIAETPGLRIDLESVQTNIVVFNFTAPIDKAAYIAALKEAGILVSDYGTRGLRIVTHYQISDNDVERAMEAIRDVTATMAGEAAHVPA